MGDVRARDCLPPSATLARKHRMCVSTFRHAYRELQREGLIEARVGATPRVACVSHEQRRELAQRRRSERFPQQGLALEELKLARKIQRRLMPPSRVSRHGFRVVSRCLPARFVSGDFYDVLPHCDGSVGVVVADVAGKGLGASLIMASVKAMLPFVAAERSVDETLREVNRQLYRSLGRREFVALAYARFTPDEGKVTLANAGVPDPLLLGTRGTVETLQVPGPRLPLGALADVAYEATVHQILPGEAMLMFSDGLPEARRPTGEQLGYEDLVEILREMRMSFGSAQSSEAWLEELLALLQRATVPVLEDDWTAVVIEPLKGHRGARGETR